MELADIRTRLAGLQGRTYWRSLEELADTPEFRQYLEREFPAQASEFTDPVGRRNFLKLMGASLALAGVSACTRQPPEALVPYVRQPEEVIPGRPLFFATAMPEGGLGLPLLAENHLGRPTKLEGNPEHPASLGATDVLAQASVLTLYDPDRSRTVLGHGNVRTWSDFTEALSLAIGPHRTTGGAGLRLLTGPISSPSLLAQIRTMFESMPEARWHQWDPVFGTAQGGVAPEWPIYRLDRADVVVSLDADPLGFGMQAVRYSKDFSSRRRISTPEDELNRLYVVESALSITGSIADHRLAVRPGLIHPIANALAAAVGVAAPGAGTLDAELQRFIQAVADDLRAHAGRSVVIAGERQPAAVHAAARAINDLLGNTGNTVLYTDPIVGSPRDGVASLAELVTDINDGAVDVLIVIGTNPVFTAPADLNFREAFEKIPNRFHMGLYYDETAELAHWHAPEAHYLESWGDVRSFDGTVSLIQPLVAPIYGGRSAIELFASINGQGGVPPVDLVREYWTAVFEGRAGQQWTLRDREGNPFPDVDTFWRTALHDGFVSGTSLLDGSQPAPQAPASAALSPAAAPAAGGIDVVFRPDPYILDGRYANNAWLQELPRPITKVTWDAVAHLSLTTATRLGVGRGDVIEITHEGRSARLPVWVLPGTPDDVVVVHFGFGRRNAGRVGSGVGFDAFPLRSSTAPWFASGAEVRAVGERYSIASTQNHFAMEERHPVRAVDIEEYRQNPKAVAELGPHLNTTVSLYPAYEYRNHKWGMAIDLNACTGCTACVIACQAENNTPVVGKAQVERSREMHWLRVDTYFEGDPAAPDGVHHQPLPCMQCEQAPCEPVCPVAATVHSAEGLNDMVYNRCVGTRYCANNCPYKVRRFNYLLYADFTTEELKAQRNPDVTIRSRGVMEKCTYCVQRINQARIDAKTEGREIRDGDIRTACEQVCPADAIVFGDLNDPESRVVQLKAQLRNYGLLEDLGTRPRTSYLARVRNPNPALA
ncbi:MAG: TAT-variant-translocated molybdopterin oxidoreductase [Acidobacteriota bacterium]|jgi:MoCo/4Fe-4S cofactor protein with predicted Tat translocation signal|nr:MAG: molybdopterin oxidoreductase [Acidobacteriota bacterium]